MKSSKTPTEKGCSKCKETKKLRFFGKDSRSKDRMRSQCKACERGYDREWKEKNYDKVRAVTKQWQDENPARMRIVNNAWRTNHPDKMKANRRREYEKKNSTPKGKLSMNISNSVRYSLKGNTKGGRNWQSLVGYTVEQLRKHIQKHFRNGMTWENQGRYWHIDHKIPIAAFNFERPEDLDFKQCWALRNLQPLESRVNESKGARLERPFQPSLRIELEKLP